MKKAKTITDSQITFSQVMGPSYANQYGSVHGAVILRFIDEAAFAVATKHSQKDVVLASVDYAVFNQPVNIADVLILKAQLCSVGRTSMKVKVDIETQRLKQDKTIKVGKAQLTMVAIDKRRRPVEVPKLILKTVL